MLLSLSCRKLCFHDAERENYGCPCAYESDEGEIRVIVKPISVAT
jgi:hypothetical protein